MAESPELEKIVRDYLAAHEAATRRFVAEVSQIAGDEVASSLVAAAKARSLQPPQAAPVHRRILELKGDPEFSDVSERAPRGAVPEAIAFVLRAKPGILAPEVVEAVTLKHPHISAKSVANTLGAQLGKKFERTGTHGTYRWYNLGDAPKHLRAAE